MLMEPASCETIMMRSIGSIANLPFLLLDTDNADSAFHCSSGISRKIYLIPQEMKPKMRLKFFLT